MSNDGIDYEQVAQELLSGNKKTIYAKDEERPSGGSGNRSGIWQDARFQHLVSDPRFKNLPKSQRKVKIDKRFETMFTDKKFNVKYTVDKYGRRVNQSTADNLRKYYELNSSASEEENEEQQPKKAVKDVYDADLEQEAAEKRKEELAISRQTDDESGESTDPNEEPGENDVLQSDGEDVAPKSLRERFLNPEWDYSRGKAVMVTDSSSDDETTEDEDDPGLQIDHVWGELGNDAPTTDESTRRLAVCNMDWDRIRAVDIMVLLSSFLQAGGSVLSVKIYTSEYGKERLTEEELKGPLELVSKDEEAERIRMKNKKQQQHLQKQKKKLCKAKRQSDDEEELLAEQDSDAEEGDEYHMEKLRQYQLNRLKYFYAVVEFDSVRTADKIYQECDGLEYESSATKVDLRFVPDDTDFDEQDLRDVCTDLPDSNTYKPRHFTTTALQQAKVDLTWDETPLERLEIEEKLLAGRMEEVNDADLRKIVACSSESETEEEDEQDAEEEKQRRDKPKATDTNDAQAPTESIQKNQKKKDEAIEKYRALLNEINEKEEREKQDKNRPQMVVTWDIENKAASQSDSEEDGAKALLTPIERVLKKRGEKNKKRKEERKHKKKTALGLGSGDSDSDDSVPDGVDLNDPYFAEEFENGEFEPKKPQKKNKKQDSKTKLREDPDANYMLPEMEEKEIKQLELLVDDDDEGKQHFSLQKIMDAENETKSKRKRRKQLKKSKTEIAAARKEVEDNFKINLGDKRFQAVYSSHLYNIDPTDSHFKKTKAMEKLIEEKLKRKFEGNEDVPTKEHEIKRPKKQLENKLLVKSLKRKILSKP